MGRLIWSMNNTLTKMSSQFDQTQKENQAQWGILEKLDSNRDKENLEAEITRRIQREIIIPIIINMATNKEEGMPTNHKTPINSEINDILEHLDRREPSIRREPEDFKQDYMYQQEQRSRSSSKK